MLNRARMRDIGDTRVDFEQLDDAIGAGLYLKDEMNRNGEEFYYMHTLIQISANDEETLKKRIATTETMCTAMDIAVKRANYKHKEAYLSALPLLSLDPI
jgi:type IV secretory pathway VirB4 component